MKETLLLIQILGFLASLGCGICGYILACKAEKHAHESIQHAESAINHADAALSALNELNNYLRGTEENRDSNRYDRNAL